jgi:hypothetical protein
MSKRTRSPHRHLPSQNSGKPEDAPRKRARMVGSNGRSFAQRITGTRPTTISDSDSSDGYVSESIHKGQDKSQSNISPLISPHISVSGTNSPSPLSHKSTERDLGAEGLAKEYDPGNPYSESEAEPKQSTASHSGKETSAGGSYGMRFLAAAEKELDSIKLEHEEVTKMIEQGEIKRRKLAEEMTGIGKVMGAVREFGL